MTLFDLKGVIDFTFDLQDNEVCGSFYIELDEISDALAKQIEVVKIERQYITCAMTDFLRGHGEEVAEYLENNYEGETLEWLKKILTGPGDITAEGGEAVYHFIERDMYDFLTQEREERKERPSMYEIVYSIEGISEGPEITDVLADSASDAVASVLKVFPCATIDRVMKEVKDWKKES